LGEKVQRGDRIGSIGDVAGDGRSIGAHLHHVHYRNGKRIQQSFYGEPVRVSVLDSDRKPDSWNAPDPVMLQGPPPRATWESAFREAKRLLDKAEKAAADATTAKGAAESALADEKAAHALTRLTLQAADARIAELEKTPPDCSAETDRALEAERKLDDIRAVLSR
jgi:alpha-beta hydrolase superfamily lysophospholipase